MRETNLSKKVSLSCPDCIIYFIFPNISPLPQTGAPPHHPRFCQFPSPSLVFTAYHYATHHLLIHTNFAASCSNCAASMHLSRTVAGYTDLSFFKFLSYVCSIQLQIIFLCKMQSPTD